jgi:hypothetical protein
MPHTTLKFIGLICINFCIAFWITGCDSDTRAPEGKTMFSWLRKGSTTPETWANPILAAQLKAEVVWPEATIQMNTVSKGVRSCRLEHSDGKPQAGQPIKTAGIEQPQMSWTSPPNRNKEGLAFINLADDLASFDIWDIDANGVLINKKSLSRLTEQIKGSKSYSLEEVFCLPSGNIWLTITYWSPGAKTGAWIYRPDTQDFKSVNIDIENDMWHDLPRPWVTTHEFNDATIAVFHTARKRLAPEIYMNQLDHIWLFSEKHPDGIEIAKVNAKDGNIRTLNLRGNILWLKTIDPEKQGAPKNYIWSLDIKNAL